MAAHRIVRDEFERSYMISVVEEDSDVASALRSSPETGPAVLIFPI